MATPEVLPDDPLERAQLGDHDAFAALISGHQSIVFSIAWNFFGNRDRAEEIAQEVFLQLFRNLRNIESRQHLLFWLRQVTTRKCIDESRRKVPPSIDIMDAEIGVAAVVPDPFLRRRVRRLIDDLPPLQRLVLTLRYQEDLGPGDIGEIVGMPLNSVKSCLHRALLSLRRDLGETV
ncbi:MAG TPA: RNA polymerase sigma factor [Thermoanaerobaculia bacterium]|jgi:RNA polymerase sigma-70 factor (ECF subfamily)|nr:RNA polymerase sigma factor [Thermoanaerobaculia bacterium]